MNKDLTLVIMAAGMGSRFGGLKQIEPVGPNGEFIIDYSIYDAIKSININCVEVHISNIHSRQEEFRKKSVTAGACIGQISGFGFYGYILAINALANSI